MESNWAELPRDLLRTIMKKVHVSSTVKSVCQNWKSILSEEAESSSLCPPPLLTVPHPQSSSASFYDVADEIVYLRNKQWRPPAVDVAKCIGSCHGWLAYIDYLCVIYLTNPFKHGSDESVIKLPSIETLPCFLGIDKVSSSSSCINFNYWNGFTEPRIARSTYLYGSLISKLVMSTGPFGKNCVVMVLFCSHMFWRIAFCKLGDKSWKILDGNRDRSYVDLYYSSDKQRFYALCQGSWSIDVWEFQDSSSSMTNNICIETTIKEIHYRRSMPSTGESRRSPPSMIMKYYLLELNGDILLAAKYIEEVTQDVDNYNWYLKYVLCSNSVVESSCSRSDVSYKTIGFDVYKLDSDKKGWELVNIIGDETVAFLGVNNAVAFSSVCDFPKLKRNSIYFTQDIYDYNPEKKKYDVSHDSGIFSFNDNNIYQCYHLGDQIMNLTPLIWISPNLC